MARRKKLSKKQAEDPYLAAREKERIAKQERDIDQFLDFTKEHPSVHDRMPK